MISGGIEVHQLSQIRSTLQTQFGDLAFIWLVSRTPQIYKMLRIPGKSCQILFYKTKSQNCVKYTRIRVFTDRFLPYKGRICKRIQVSENPYSRILYAVQYKRIPYPHFVFSNSLNSFVLFYGHLKLISSYRWKLYLFREINSFVYYCQYRLYEVPFLQCNSHHWDRSGVFIVNFEQISHILLFLLLTLN